jgi:hypothetical protein
MLCPYSREGGYAETVIVSLYWPDGHTPAQRDVAILYDRAAIIRRIYET